MKRSLSFLLVLSLFYGAFSQPNYLKNNDATTGTFIIKSPTDVHVSLDYQNNDFNFPLGVLQWAGDINGDGIDDAYFNAGYCANANTPDPYDRILKSVLVYGADNYTNLSRHVFNYHLIPVGDINGDSKDDFFHDSKDGNYQLLYGGDNGNLVEGRVFNKETDWGISGSLLGIKGFNDIDGDGIIDIVVNLDSSTFMTVIYGASDESAMSINQYAVGFGRGPSGHAKKSIGNLIGSKSQLLNIYAEEGNASNAATDDDMNVVFEVFEFSNSTFSKVKEFKLPSELVHGRVYGGYNRNYGLADVTGDGKVDWIYGLNYQSLNFLQYSGDQLQLGGLIYDDMYVGIAMQPDLNNDGKADFISGNKLGHLNAGSRLNFDFTFDNTINSVGDINNDGVNDIVAVERENNKVGYKFYSWENNAYAESALLYEENAPSTTQIKMTQSVGDFNGDGTSDYIGYSDDKFWLYLNSANDAPEETSFLQYHEEEIEKIVALDYNGDNINDIICLTNYYTSTNRLYRLVFFKGNTAGELNVDATFLTTEWVVPAYEYTETMLDVIGDVDNDGCDDLVIATSDGSGKFKVIFGGDDPNAFYKQEFSASGSYNTFMAGRATALGDINGDDIDDFVFGEVTDGVGSCVYFGTGDRAADAYSSADVIINESTPEVAISIGGFNIDCGDFNSDGQNDIVIVINRMHVTPGNESADGYNMLYVYNGGTGFDNIADVKLKIPHSVFGLADEGTISTFKMELNVVPDINKDGADELFLGNNFIYGSSNLTTSQKYAVILFGGNHLVQDNLSGIQLEGYGSVGGKLNNRYASDFKSAIGDFDGNGSVEIYTMCNDGNYNGSSVYEYKLNDDATAQKPDAIKSSNFVYPNPASEFLNISNEYQGYNYTIYSLAGAFVDSGIVDNKIAISHLTNGVYFICIDNQSNKLTQKVIVRK